MKTPRVLASTTVKTSLCWHYITANISEDQLPSYWPRTRRVIASIIYAKNVRSNSYIPGSDYPMTTTRVSLLEATSSCTIKAPGEDAGSIMSYQDMDFLYWKKA